MSETHLKWYHHTLHEYLSNEEIETLMQKRDWRAALEILHTWCWIAFAFALAGFFPNPVTVLTALFILGGKQLACAIILHDCSHDSMFHSRAANRFAGNWFGAYPVFHDVDKYRPYHLRHHLHTGMDDDPDLPLTTGYPATAGSMCRKFLRDLLGLSGIKGNIAVLLMQAGLLRYALNGRAEWVPVKGKPVGRTLLNAVKNLAGPLTSNMILLGLLSLAGAPWLYLLWVGALFTTYNFSLRVRSMAEHSMTDDRHNPHKNTRTTYAGFAERLFFAPHHVNYHAEHHLCMGVPSYNLPAMHRLLAERGYFKGGVLEQNYIKIIRRAIKSEP